jgi:monoamine oxidase
VTSLAATADRRPDVVVIGGGLAGLSAARLLKRQGASVVLTEARDRIGGRVHTERLDGGPVIDLGAQFIGDAQRRISGLVDEVGLTRVGPSEHGDSLYRAAEGSVPMRLAGDDLPLSFLSQLDAYQATRRLGRGLVGDRRERARLDTIPAAAFVRELSFTRGAASFLTGYLDSETCVPGNEISALEMLEQMASIGGLEGERRSAQWFLAEGTGPLAQHLADGLGASVVTSAPVSQLHERAERIVVETPRGSFAAQQVVVAVPPQLYGRVGLWPWMPPTRRDVLLDYRPGTVVKTVLVFKSPWWRDLGLSGRYGGAAGLFNAMVDGSPADGSAGVLVLFATACSGRRLAAAGSEAERIGIAMAELRGLVATAIPAPLAARSVDWNADPWSLGGYASRRGPGAWVKDPDLFRSLGRIHFAGTETATEWRSFMEGALQSAEIGAAAALRGLNDAKGRER